MATMRGDHPILLGREGDHRMESTSGEFYYLKLRPEFPKAVKAVAIAHLHYDTKTKRLYFDRLDASQWVASLWILDECCQVDLAVILKEDGLQFIEGNCVHGEDCPKVEKLKQAVLESEAFSRLREDLIHKLFQGTVADLHPAQPLQFQRTVSPWEEDKSL